MISKILILLLAASFPILYYIKVFQRLGLEFHEAVAILLLPFLLVWSPPLKIAEYKDVLLYVSLTGFLIPFFISIGFLYSGKVSLLKFLGGTVIICFITYFGSYAAAEVGVVVRTVVLVPFVASYYALRVAVTGELAPLAYSSATMGTVIGADVLRMSELVKSQSDIGNTLLLAIGGGGIKDAIYVSGTMSVVLCILFMVYALSSGSESESRDFRAVKSDPEPVMSERGVEEAIDDEGDRKPLDESEE